MIEKRFSYAFPFLLLTVLLSACTDLPKHTSPLSELVAQSAEPPLADYVIGVGDEVEIKFIYTTELNDRVTVRPDGKISLSMVQDIKAAGLTPKQLARLLRQRLADKVKHPELVIILRGMASQRAFVGGEVAKAGSVQLAGNETLIQALNMAGWVTPDASTSRIVLLRRYADDDQRLYIIDYEKLASGENLAMNVRVKAGDVILVPPSDITAVGRWVDKYLRKSVPFTTTAGAYYSVNPSSR